MAKKIIISSSLFIILSICMCLGLTQTIDVLVYRVITEQSPFILHLSSAVSFLASTSGLLILSLLLIFFLPTNKERKCLILILLISVLTIIISKNIFMRPRPLLGQLLQSYSYPSGHSFAAMIYFGFLFYIVLNSRLNNLTRTILQIMLGICMITIPISRLILGVHYLSDVIAGLLLGYVFLQLVIYRYEHMTSAKKETSLVTSFYYALEGIKYTIKHERNMQIHLLIMCLVIVAGFVFKITWFEWLICFILFGLVLSLELLNTAIENVVDLVTEEQQKKAKIAKDTAAGAVLIVAIISAIIGLCIFLPYLFA